MDGRVVLVSGATSGIGLAAATALAGLGARVHLLARNAERGERAREQTGAERVWDCDVSSLRSVREFAGRFAAEQHELHVLVNNAGLLAQERSLSVDGYELAFATNVLGPFLLTGLLASSMIINVSSGGMYTARLDTDDLQTERHRYDGAAVYARHKRMQVVLSEMCAERLNPEGVAVHSMHPGWVDTPGLEHSLPRFYKLMKPALRSPEEGADTIVWLAATQRPGGGFWHDREQRPTHVLKRTRESDEERQRLWDECVRLTGLEL